MLITIGSFDGFHRGHAELLRLCRENSDGNNWAVVTFHPHPSEYMHRLSHTLFTLRERELFRRILDIPNMYVLEFSDALRSLTPRDFWRLVRERFCVDGLVMGSDFHFGLNHAGSAEYLSRLAKYDGLSRIIIADVIDKPRYSSSTIRACVKAGKVEEAAKLLGCPYFMLGRVIHGTARGRTMHFPTANIDIHGRTVPAFGVYCSSVLVNGGWHCGALSLGTNPTFHDVHETRCEVYILDFTGDIYGEELPVFFLGRVRDMHTFTDKDALMKQIAQDIENCRKIYAQAFTTGTRNFLERAGKIYCTQDLNPEIIKLV